MRSHALHRTQYDLELGLDIDLRTETRVDCAGERLSRSGSRGRLAEHTEKDPSGDPAAPDEYGRDTWRRGVEAFSRSATQGCDGSSSRQASRSIGFHNAAIGG